MLGEIDWRQRLDNGQYSVKMVGIDEQQPDAFPAYPYGAGDQQDARLDRDQGQFLPQPELAVRLERHLDVATNSSPTTTSCRASTSATTISRTSSRRSTFAARPTTASSTSARTTSRARRPTTTTGTLPQARAGVRLQSRLRGPGRSHLRPRRPGDGRRQHRQHHADQRGVPVDRPADVRQRLSPVQRLRDGRSATNT